ncbi:MAG: hypothetical protein LQ350_003753 [Teloschistes chrysophthalmus]|nr:MAG: hypothetical protein LQ350_003753 [Niorma chrysophthalma]
MLTPIQEAEWYQYELERQERIAIAKWRSYARGEQSILYRYGRNHLYNRGANDPEHTEKGTIMAVMVLDPMPLSDTAPLVEVEMLRLFAPAYDEDNLREMFKELYTTLRTRGDPWYKIEAIPTQIDVSTEIKRIVRRTLQHERDKERAAIFKQCFPHIICDQETLEPLEQLEYLRGAGYHDFPLSLLREARRLVRDDSSDFDREENRAISMGRARERWEVDEDEGVSMTGEDEAERGMAVLEPLMGSEDWWHPSMSPTSFSSSSRPSSSNGYLRASQSS